MKKMLSLLAASLVFAVGAVHAADDAKTAKPKKPSRMAVCAQEFKASGKPKSEYRAFSSECLKTKKAAAGK